MNTIPQLIIDNQKSYVHIPKYILILIEEGHILPDGKTVTKALNEVALSLQKQDIIPTETLLRTLFVKRDGKPYSLKACKQAVIYANTT